VFVDSNTAKWGEQTPEQRAKTTALVRRMAAAYPAQDTLIKQLRATLAEREATLLKLQGSDPGAGGEGGGSGGGSGEKSGTDAMTEEIDKLVAANR